MKITKLISVFERLLPIYKEAYENDLNKEELYLKNLDDGLCHAAYILLIEDISGVFEKGYYRNYIVYPTLFGTIRFLFPVPKTGKDLKPRIDFMEREIKSLKRLMKKGYTHV